MKDQDRVIYKIILKFSRRDIPRQGQLQEKIISQKNKKKLIFLNKQLPHMLKMPKFHTKITLLHKITVTVAAKIADTSKVTI